MIVVHDLLRLAMPEPSKPKTVPAGGTAANQRVSGPAASAVKPLEPVTTSTKHDYEVYKFNTMHVVEVNITEPLNSNLTVGVHLFEIPKSQFENVDRNKNASCSSSPMRNEA